ncbi:dermatan-sulfate epimerase-like protein [Mobula birostris]|uniref:dermatan-sulfate epimerase-like protein n=1 Tax=Mobula birostris TaxID=1983395 RepID=UPI003B27E60C
MAQATLFLLLAAALSLAGAASGQRSGDGQPSAHPLLYFEARDVRSLRQKARGSHSSISRAVRAAVKTMLAKPGLYLPPPDHASFSAKWNEVYGNNLGVLSLYCLLFPEDAAALEFALTYLDRMASYPSWQVRAAPNDEVPVAHSLSGFATALDFLYSVLDEDRRQNYMQKVNNVTMELYEFSKYRAWGKHFLHNHQATNVLALLTGALVLTPHQMQAALLCKQFAIDIMEKTLFLLSHVVDGSLDEGVAYGSYTSKSITQYIFLALRHFNLNHTGNPWLKQHFWFYYATLLPGFQRSVGIADSNYNWFYGPESQLVFLDRFVLRDGSGNWLAKQIRKHRPKDGPMEPSSAHRWCTLHTEFIWYDPGLSPRPPAIHGSPRLHVFPNWGVVTYGGGLEQEPGHTFVSFKSGKLGGRAVYEMVHGAGSWGGSRGRPYSWIDGWKSFNPGHEHPDQNSFTFAPGGRPFVSEALYGPKHSYLNNVLVFGPSPSSHCNWPWEGQLGECGQWLDWTAGEAGGSAGEVVTASHHGGMVFTSGEAALAYSSAMGLRSVYRALMLLNAETLLVVDHLERQPDSPLRHASAFFHNLDLDFRYVPWRSQEGLHGALLDVWDAQYKVVWFSAAGDSPEAQIQEAEQAAEFKKRWTQFINVTFALRGPVTRMAFLFHGPSVRVSDCRFLEDASTGLKVALTINDTPVVVWLATRHDDPSSRFSYLGFGGYAKVEEPHQVTRFGLGTVSVAAQTPSLSRSYPGPTAKVVAVAAAAAGMPCLALGLAAARSCLSLSFGRLLRLAMLAAISLWLAELAALWAACRLPLCSGGGEEGEPVPASPSLQWDQALGRMPPLVITSLPGSGAEILRHLFSDVADFLYVRLPTEQAGVTEAEFGLDPLTDACEWTAADAQQGRYRLAQGWLQSLVHGTKLHLQNLPLHPRVRGSSQKKQKHRRRVSLGGEAMEGNTEYLGRLQRHLDAHPNARVVLSLSSGAWTLKMPFVHGVLGAPTRLMLVVRDPRAWVQSLLSHAQPGLSSLGDVPGRLAALFGEDVGEGCGSAAFEYKSLQRQFADPTKSAVALLAHLWLANIKAAMRINGKLPSENYQLLKFEDVVTLPRETAEKVYAFLGFPLPPAVLNRMLFATSTNLLHLPFEGDLAPGNLHTWRETMSLQDIKTIEDICWSVMSQLGYSRFTS